MSMDVKEIHPQKGVRVEHDGYLAYQHADQLKGIRRFEPPCTIRFACQLDCPKTHALEY